MVSRTLAILLALSGSAFAGPNPLRSCEVVCKQITCIHIPANRKFKMVFDSGEANAGRVYLYAGEIGPDEAAESSQPFTRPVMFCGSGYPAGMGRVLERR